MLAAAAIAYLMLPWRFEASCLPDANLASKRVTVDGEMMPLGVWRNDWMSATLASHVFRIIAEDILGYEVVLGPPGDGSVSAIWALAGCAPNQNCLYDDTKREPVRRYHIALDTFPWAARECHQWLKVNPEKAPLRISDIGYAGIDGTFIPAAKVSAVLAATGVSLTSPSSYNVSVHDVSSFFSRVQAVDIGLLARCNSSAVRQSFVGQGGFDRYPNAFPDDVHGYFVDDDGHYWPNCSNGTWWLAPACREDPQKCIPWITYKAWTATLHMQRATLYNMPLAIGFADNWTAYERIQRQHDVLMYWFRPDFMFLDLDMQLLPWPHDEYKMLGDKLANRRQFPQTLDKWVVKDLRESGPLQVVERLQILDDDMDYMLREVASGKAAEVAACDWLTRDSSHPQLWRAWIPARTDCVEGQGWADDFGRAVSNHTDATQCTWCPLGSVSTYDRQAAGYLCIPCTAGKYFLINGKGSCEDCDRGRFSSLPEQTACKWCEPGKYASELGSSSCTSCPPLFVTDGAGGTNSTSCVCDQGMYLSVASDSSRTCQSCGLLHTSKFLGADSPNDCNVDEERVRRGGLVACFVVCSCAAAVAAAVFRRYKRLLQDEVMHKTLKQGLRSMSMPQHPMCLVPFLCFCELADSELSDCYEGARDRGSLLVLDTAQDIQDFQDAGRKILFFSYPWTSWEKLGPNSLQVSCMKAAARQVSVMADVDPEHLFVWLDILGIPQANKRCKALAVDSLYVYASKADFLVVICPEGIHEQTAEVVNVETYKSRVFCRVEQMAHFSCHGLGAMWYTERPGELVAIDEAWLRDAVHIFEGQVTCCRLGHPGKRECDRQLLVPTVLAMYTVLLQKSIRGLPADIRPIWNLMNVDRNRTFPRSFSYNESGKMCRRDLFGSTGVRPLIYLHGPLLDCYWTDEDTNSEPTEQASHSSDDSASLSGEFLLTN
eukprot:TRINITY_DN49244_c0_g1_i2.p1 TRINITY_DN49244_c0_g1~~TRINITY_DN49244_c0_g1_i2.p1  ORF type:complete len:943 (+),score=97.31 TRINITY_DN49244_c0_g1_i2:84-2912(+)